MPRFPKFFDSLNSSTEIRVSRNSSVERRASRLHALHALTSIDPLYAGPPTYSLLSPNLLLSCVSFYYQQIQIYQENLEKAAQKLLSEPFQRLIASFLLTWKLFKPESLNLLVYLVDEQKMDPEAALSEIDQLDKTWVHTLRCFYEQGLRGSHLRELKNHILEHQPDFDNFEELHEILNDCINKQQLSMTDALEEIKSIYFSSTLRLD